jgi:hypothetical protein
MRRAIDPGKNGGIAISFYSKKIIAVPMPESRMELLNFFKSTFDAYRYDAEPSMAFIEKVHSMPKQGIVSAFNFGKQVERICMLMAALNIPYDEDITPQKWQKGLGIPPRNKTESKREHKNKLLRKAQQLYPEQFQGLNKTVSLKIADALLILEYARRYLINH